MAFTTITNTIKYLFLKKLLKFLLPQNPLPKIYSPPLKRQKALSYNNLLHAKTLLPLMRNVLMKNENVYENLVNQAVSQSKFCTASKGDCDLKSKSPPPGRHQFHKETEDSINAQIGAELTAGFCYLSMACYFGRTEVALPGCQGFFLNMYEEELEHAMVFINYSLMRGAHIALSPINMPQSQDWKSINNAFSAALELEKTVKEKLVSVFNIAEKHKDLQVMDIISTQFMEEQNRSICELARLLKKSEMAEDPLGEYIFDKLLYKSFVEKSKDNLMYKNKLDESESKVYK